MLRKSVLVAWVCVSACLSSSVVHAHISLDKAGTHKSRYGDTDDDIKKGPCGHAGGKRGTNVYTYKAGETIDVEVSEFVSHPGYFRIAFDNDGDDGFKAPARIPSMPPSGRACMGADDKCGEPDFYNNETVLPGMDNLEPHMKGDNGKIWKWQVKLPNVSCDNCTLQIIQIMAESFRAPYDPDATTGVGDVYYQCIDLVLTPNDASAGAGAAAPTETAGSAAPTPTPRPSSQSMTTMSAGAAGNAGLAMSAAVGAPMAAGSGGSDVARPLSPSPSAQAAPTGGTFAAPTVPLAPAPSANSSGCNVGSGESRFAGAAWLLPAITVMLRRRRTPRPV